MDDIIPIPKNQIPQVASLDTEKSLQSKMQNMASHNQERLTQIKAAQTGVEYIDLNKQQIPYSILNIISSDQAVKMQAVCFFKDPKLIKIAAVDPENPEVFKLLENLTKKYKIEGEIFMASKIAVKKTIELYQNIKLKPTKGETGLLISEELITKFQKQEINLASLEEKIKQINMTELLSLILAASISANASDIHLESTQQGFILRFRIDGVLKKIADIEDTAHFLLSRIKLLSKIKLNISSKPQDGRFTFSLHNEEIDLRCSTLPSEYGESVVIRILRQKGVELDLEKLGMRKEHLDILEHETKRPNGIIITTGPTGSGKTSTLYAVLKKLNKPEVKIITLEEPVEYKLEGITQTPIHEDKNFGFAQGLKSVLRQDPDIIMVGEIRDIETAKTAVNAALTGHLVLSTLHTNDAVGSVSRFLSFEIENYLLAPALNLIMAQRLVRRICPKCKKPDELQPELIEQIKKELEDLPKTFKDKIDFSKLEFFKGEGCKPCHGLGLKGRLGIFELVPIAEDFKKLILEKEFNEQALREQAKKQGLISMVQDGLLKVLEGMTSVKELFRVTE